MAHARPTNGKFFLSHLRSAGALAEHYYRRLTPHFTLFTHICPPLPNLTRQRMLCQTRRHYPKDTHSAADLTTADIR